MSEQRQRTFRLVTLSELFIRGSLQECQVQVPLGDRVILPAVKMAPKYDIEFDK